MIRDALARALHDAAMTGQPFTTLSYAGRDARRAQADALLREVLTGPPSAQPCPSCAGPTLGGGLSLYAAYEAYTQDLLSEKRRLKDAHRRLCALVECEDAEELAEAYAANYAELRDQAARAERADTLLAQLTDALQSLLPLAAQAAQQGPLARAQYERAVAPLRPHVPFEVPRVPH